MNIRYQAAWCHLVYRAGGAEEMRIWNGRDGPVPDRLVLPSGAKASIVKGPVVRQPSYIPEVGERIFIALHPERAVQIAAAKVEEFWAHPRYPLSSKYRTKDEAVEDLATRFFGDGNAPDLVEVTPFLRQRYLTGDALAAERAIWS